MAATTWTTTSFVSCFFLLAAVPLRSGVAAAAGSSESECARVFADPAYGTHANITVNGIRLHYVENGDREKPLMLFVPGFPEFWHVWRHQLKHFAKTHWVVALDMRGFGGSEKPPRVDDYHYDTLQKDIVELVRGLGRSSTILVAHDWGGLISWGVASNYPEVVSKLIVLNAPHPNIWLRTVRHSSPEQLLKSWYVFPFLMPYFSETVLYYGVRLATPAMFRLPLVSLLVTLDEEGLAAYKCHYRTKGLWTPPLNFYRSLISHRRLQPPFDSAKEVPKVPASMPVMVIWGTPEPYLDARMPELCRQYADNLRIEYVPGGTHFVTETKSDDVNRIIESFI